MTNQAGMRRRQQNSGTSFDLLLLFACLSCDVCEMFRMTVFKRPADSAWKMWKTSRCPASLRFLYIFLRFLLMQTFAWRQNLCFLKSSSAPAAYWPCHASAQQNLCYAFSKAVYERWLTEDCFLCCVLPFCLKEKKKIVLGSEKNLDFSSIHVLNVEMTSSPQICGGTGNCIKCFFFFPPTLPWT